MGHFCIYVRFEFRISSIVEKVIFCLRSKTSGSNFDISFPLLLTNIVWVLSASGVSSKTSQSHSNSCRTYDRALFFPVISVSSHSSSSSSKCVYVDRAPPHVNMSLFPWGNLLTINRWNDMPFLLVRAVYAVVAIHSSNSSNSLNAIAAIGHRQLEGLHAPMEMDAIDILGTFLYTRSDTTHKSTVCNITYPNEIRRRKVCDAYNDVTRRWERI